MAMKAELDKDEHGPATRRNKVVRVHRKDTSSSASSAGAVPLLYARRKISHVIDLVNPERFP